MYLESDSLNDLSVVSSSVEEKPQIYLNNIIENNDANTETNLHRIT